MHVSLSTLIKEALAGKSIGRILFNERLHKLLPDIRGEVLDLAGGDHPRYYDFLHPSVHLTRTNRIASEGVIAVDINALLPFADHSFDAVLLMNAIYIAERPEHLAKEIRRVLKPGGTWLFSSPFLGNEMPEPHEYVRYAYEGLERLCTSAGYSFVSIERIGERGSAAMTLLSPFALFNAVRACLYPIALMLDALVPKRVRDLHPAPLFYLVTARK